MFSRDVALGFKFVPKYWGTTILRDAANLTLKDKVGIGHAVFQAPPCRREKCR
jgi:hypothetical protein